MNKKLPKTYIIGALIILSILSLFLLSGCDNLITGKAVYAPKAFTYELKADYKELWFTIDNNNTFTECTATLETIKDNKALGSSTIKLADIIPDQKVNGILHYDDLEGADQHIEYECW